MTTIEWTEKVWNPVVGCSRVSAGCEHCYAERVAHRQMQSAHEGLTVLGKHGPRWNGTVRTLPERLEQPLRWRKPRRIFVNSMSDLFHEAVPFEFVAAVFGVMAACPQHTFQVLTKRLERAREFVAWFGAEAELYGPHAVLHVALGAYFNAVHIPSGGGLACERVCEMGWDLEWPLPNVHLGVSCEDQATADERIPILLELPAAVRWVSLEPMLGAVNLQQLVHRFRGNTRTRGVDALFPSFGPRLDWVVIGGESGPGARPFDLAWARSVTEQCERAGVPVFVKQLGAHPVNSACIDGVSRPPGVPVPLRDRKGGDMSEWPADLRVREFPRMETA